MIGPMNKPRKYDQLINVNTTHFRNSYLKVGLTSTIPSKVLVDEETSNRQ